MKLSIHIFWVLSFAILVGACRKAYTSADTWRAIPNAGAQAAFDSLPSRIELPAGTVVKSGWQLIRTGGVSKKGRPIGYAFIVEDAGIEFDLETDQSGVMHTFDGRFRGKFLDVIGTYKSAKWRVALVNTEFAQVTMVGLEKDETVFVAIEPKNVR